MMPLARFLALACLLACGGCAKRFTGRGMVLQVDPTAPSVLISHADIPGYMPAMAMPFTPRKASEIAALHPGDQVRFDLVVGRSKSRIDRIQRLSAGVTDVVLPPN